MQQDSVFGAAAVHADSPTGPVSQGNAPAAELGASFEQPALAPLRLSTKARVWGDASSSAFEPPLSQTWSPQDRAAFRLKFGHRCMFCGLESQALEIHNRNQNHGDMRPENLGPADPLCHRWQHLGELGKGNALLVYLPDLSPRDASHLLRTTLVGLLSNVPAMRASARKVLNWMASHQAYVAEAWGSSDPVAFAAALARAVSEDRDRQDLALSNLALVVHPDSLSGEAAHWRNELEGRHREASWPDLHHRVTNAPT